MTYAPATQVEDTWISQIHRQAEAAGLSFDEAAELAERSQDAAVATERVRKGKRPVAFRMFYNGRWLLYESELEIEKYANMCGVDYQELYVREDEFK